MLNTRGDVRAPDATREPALFLTLDDQSPPSVLGVVALDLVALFARSPFAPAVVPRDHSLTLTCAADSFVSLDPDTPVPAHARLVYLEHHDRAHDRFVALPVVTVGERLHPASVHAVVAWVRARVGAVEARWTLTRNDPPARVWGRTEACVTPLAALDAVMLPACEAPTGGARSEVIVPDFPDALREALQAAHGDPARETDALTRTEFPLPRVTVLPLGAMPPHRFRAPPPEAPALVIAPGDDGVLLGVAEELRGEQRLLALQTGLAHVLLGHVRPGDPWAHWDTLATLSDSTPARHWDRAVRTACARWFEPPRPRSLDECSARDKALLGLHRMMRDRLGGAGSLVEEATRYQKAAYQRQAAQRLVTQLDAYRGAMLCDGVGLGKTYVATTVIVHYANVARRETSGDGEPFRVTVLAPGAVVETWEREALPPLAAHGVAVEHVRVISHAKLSRVTAGSAVLEARGALVSDLEHLIFSDLVIVDEAHNFRAISARRTLVLRDILRLGVRRSRSRRVLLLTATPINNSLQDLEQEASLLFAETLPLEVPKSAARADVKKWEQAAREVVRKRCEQARQQKNRQADVLEAIVHGPDGRIREAFNFRDDLQLGTMHLGKYLQRQEAALQELQERVRAAAALGVMDESPRPRIAEELLDRVVVQRSRALCKEIEQQEGARVDLLFRPDPGTPERILYADEYDGTQNVLAEFLPLFDEEGGRAGAHALSFKVYMWKDVEAGTRGANDTSPAVGLQRVLALKRLESSPVTFLITVLRLTVLHAARVEELIRRCKAVGLEAELRRLGKACEDIVRKQPSKQLRTVRWLAAGDRVDDPATGLLAKLAGARAQADEDDADLAPVQMGFFNEVAPEDEGEVAKVRRLLGLGDRLLGDLATLLRVVPRLANVVFGRFEFEDWPGGFIAPGAGRAWPTSAAWAARMESDPKLRALFRRLLDARREGRKALVFSQFTDTLDYIRSVLDACRGLPPAARRELLVDMGFEDPDPAEFDGLLERAATVTGDTDDRDRVIDRFAPYYRLRPFPPADALRTGWEADWLEALRRPVDVLFSSDVLAEGVNLQDVSLLINFDVHWNPVRMIQRAGRVDRRLDPRIEREESFPELEKIALREGCRYPRYWWRDHPGEAPVIANMILPDALEEELALRERLATKTLAIDFTLGLERGTGAEADWMREYRYRGVTSLNAFQQDRAIERLGAVYRTVEQRLAARGVDPEWSADLNVWVRDRGADDATPVIARALLNTSHTPPRPYTRYLEPRVHEGVPHWLWDTEPPSALLAAWLPLGTDHIGKERKDLPYRAEASRRLRPEHLLAASAALLAPDTEIDERPSDDPAVGDQVFQGMPAVAAGFFGSRDERLDLQMDQVVILQLAGAGER